MNKTIHEMSITNEETWQISANKGETLSIKIRGNKTTGYSWFLSNREKLSNDSLQPLNLKDDNSSKDYVTDEHPDGYCGVGGYFYFDFKVADEAKYQVIVLSFSFRRPWEPKENEKITDVNVTIGTKIDL
jgi:predicted secreted protein